MNTNDMRDYLIKHKILTHSQCYQIFDGTNDDDLEYNYNLCKQSPRLFRLIGIIHSLWFKLRF